MKEFEIIDSHAHVFPEKIAEKATNAIGNFYGIEMKHVGTVEELKKSADEIGVKWQVICSSATKPSQVTAINDFIYGLCCENDKFIGFATLHPDYKDVDKEIQRIVERGFFGIKIHSDFQEFEIDSPKAVEMYGKIAKADLPVLFHLGDENGNLSNPASLRKVLEKNNDLKAIGAHFGGYRQWDESIKCFKGVNMYFDTSSSLSFLSEDEVMGLFEAFGIDRFFFGSDFPMWGHRDEFERFMKLPLTNGERELVLSGNFKRLFNI
jgi:predicted TIM-barrel fold metal-dependent hydrolase